MRYYLKNHYRSLFLLFASVLLHSLIMIRVQFMKGEILDIAVSGVPDRVLPVVLIFTGMLVLQMTIQQLSSTLRVRLSAHISKDIKNRIFESLIERDLSTVDRVERSDVMTKYTNDIQMIESNFLSMGGRFFEFSMIIITSGVSLIYIHYKIAILALIVFLVPMLLINMMKSSISRAESDFIKINQAHIDKLMKYLKGLEAIKNYSIEKEIDRHYAHSLDSVTRADMKRSFKRSLANGMSFFSTMISQSSILIYAAYLLYRGEIGAGTFVTVFSLIMVLRPPFYWISQLYEHMIASRPAIQSVQDFISENLSCSAPPCPLIASSDTASSGFSSANPSCEPGEIRIDRISYSYDEGNPIFENFSLTVRPKEKVLIVGQSGSGKTTLINLITGRAVPASGSIRRGSGYSYFKQDSFIFNAGIKDNLTLFRDDISDEEIARVSAICGIESLLQDRGAASEFGSNLSGGEKKRVALARTLLDNQPIWILDEPFANIDAQKIERIEDLIVQDRDHTVLIVSHIVSEKLRSSVNRIIDLSERSGN